MQLPNDEYIKRLEENLGKKLQVLKEILELTHQQETVIDEDDYVKLNVLIAKKQEKIDLIDTLDKPFEVYFKRLKSALKVNTLDEAEVNSMPGIGQIKRLVEAVFNVLEDIQKQEAVNHQKVRSAYGEIKESIHRVKATKNANKAYLGPKSNEPESYFIDSKK